MAKKSDTTNPSRRLKPAPGLIVLRQAIEKTLGEMDQLLDGVVEESERGMFADAIFETLRRSPLFADMSGEA